MDGHRAPPAPSLDGSARVLGVLAALALALLLLLQAAPSPRAEGNAFWEERVEPAAPGARVTYVGYDPGSFDPRGGYDEDRILDALAAWREGHLRAVVSRALPVEIDGYVVGVRITFAPMDARPPLGIEDDLETARVPVGSHALDSAA